MNRNARADLGRKTREFSRERRRVSYRIGTPDDIKIVLRRAHKVFDQLKSSDIKKNSPERI